MTHRILVGARGLIGQALAARLAGLPGELLAVDSARNSPPDPPSSTPIITLDCRSGEFADRAAAYVQDADRVELYHAAGSIGALARIADTSLDSFRAVVEDNLSAAYAAIRAVAEAARRANAPGSLTVIGSVGATRAHRYRIAYDAAQAGVESLTRGFALEYGPHGITARTVAVGPVAESATTAADGPRRGALVDLVPLGRYATVEEIAAAIAVVGSPVFDTANGETIILDGGLSKQLRPGSIERPPER